MVIMWLVLPSRAACDRDAAFWRPRQSAHRLSGVPSPRRRVVVRNEAPGSPQHGLPGVFSLTTPDRKVGPKAAW